MDLGIRKRVAVVTAASKGLGYAVAEQLANEGARVAITARGVSQLNASGDALQKTSGSEIFAYPCDVSKADQLSTFLEEVNSNIGSPDILVVNAGGPPPGGFDGVTDSQWQDAFELTLMSAIRMIRHVLPGMRERRWGRILLMVSISAKQPLANMLLSNSIRAGVLGMAKTLADEVAKDGVLINCLLPGFIRTGRMEEVVQAQANQANIPFDEHLKQIESQIPVGRLGKPEEFGKAAAFLVSDAASFMTGGVFLCDGGMYRGLI